ncbi:DUF2165 domain-containing protein [Sphingopyxis sp. DHUNG17]|uniref:DUF2165 domain-containing protein n=1 Tax=Sphingopyxis jiangsuensis TaxID=2871171 RepID=UPI00191F3509|nr:DUF2165 domain-containing protein [Sphingopyxis lutea]MBL0769892.1 DUF2165 domain-containing protein [Sphingopyxis lutea]
MLRILKILLVIAVATWGLLGAFGNFHDWQGTKGAVAATLSMTTFEGGSDDWRATASPALVLAGALAIPALKLVTALLCLAGAWRMWAVRGGDAATFDAAKTLALAGCGVAVLMLFAGWIVIAETWFELWRSEAMREAALDAALRYGAFIGIIALFVGAREP